jgi:hypothetical protein
MPASFLPDPQRIYERPLPPDLCGQRLFAKANERCPLGASIAAMDFKVNGSLSNSSSQAVEWQRSITQ